MVVEYNLDLDLSINLSIYLPVYSYIYLFTKVQMLKELEEVVEYNLDPDISIYLYLSTIYLAIYNLSIYQGPDVE